MVLIQGFCEHCRTRPAEGTCGICTKPICRYCEGEASITHFCRNLVKK